MKQAVFVRHKRERNVYHVVWFEQGRERTRSYPTRQEAEQEKQRRLELLAQGNAPELFDLLPPHEKRELFAIHERAREKGYELWDVARLHERQLEQQRVPGIEIGKAVKALPGGQGSRGSVTKESAIPALGPATVRLQT